MKNKTLIDIFLIAILVIAFAMLLNPFDFVMKGSVEMMFLSLLSLFVIGLLVFFWKEEARDEREELHLYKAGRASFFSVAIILLIGLIYQSFILHDIDPFIPVALCTLLVSKVVALLFLRDK